MTAISKPLPYASMRTYAQDFTYYQGRFRVNRNKYTENPSRENFLDALDEYHQCLTAFRRFCAEKCQMDGNDRLVKFLPMSANDIKFITEARAYLIKYVGYTISPLRDNNQEKILNIIYQARILNERPTQDDLRSITNLNQAEQDQD